MKTIMLAAAAVALTAAVNSGSALAGVPVAHTASAVSRTAENQMPSQSVNQQHYEWQYHYGRKAQFEGQWVPVR